MKQISKYIKVVNGTLLAGGLLLTACTSHFESWNINPNEVTPEQMERDNLKTGAYFTQMERGIFVVGKDKGGLFEETQMLTGDIFASYFAPVKTWDYAGTEDNDCYKLYRQWYNSPFNNAYTEVMQPWQSIVENTDEVSPARALATIVKVFGMSRITDKYGPIPYSKFGTGIHVAYDSQKDVYYRFFEELADAIDVLTGYNSRTSEPYMERYDYIYNGRVEKWIKFANTLRLRLAMRISYVDETKARTEIEAAIGHSIGLMTSVDDNAVLKQSASFTFINEGATESLQAGMKNVAFLRTNIEIIERFFAEGEVSEIWLTFSDPQMKKATKRLTSTYFMERYRKFLQPNGIIHLKTDSNFMFTYTKYMIEANRLPVEFMTEDLYHSDLVDDILGIKTYYEQQWLDRGLAIKYIKFRLPQEGKLQEPDVEIELDPYRSYNRSKRSGLSTSK